MWFCSVCVGKRKGKIWAQLGPFCSLFFFSLNLSLSLNLWFVCVNASLFVRCSGQTANDESPVSHLRQDVRQRRFLEEAHFQPPGNGGRLRSHAPPHVALLSLPERLHPGSRSSPSHGKHAYGPETSVRGPVRP